MSVPLALRNTFHEKGKLLLSVAGVAASLTLIMLIVGLRAGLYATIAAYVNHLEVDLIVAQSGVQGMFSSASAVPIRIHDEVEAAAGARETGHILVADVIFTRNDSKTPVVLVGYDPDSAFGAPWNIGEGRLIQDDDEIMLDTWLAQRSGTEVGDTVTLLGKGFTVVGLTRETSSWMSPYIFVSLKAAEDALGLSGMVSYHLLRLPANADTDAAMSAIEATTEGVEVMTPEEIAEADQRVLATVMDTPISVLVVISVVIGIAVMGLTAYTSVADRIREYGVLKAIGAGRARLSILVVTETLYQSLFGFVLGIGITYLASQFIMANWPQFYILVQPVTFIQVGGLAVIMTSLAALLPIRQLSQIDPLLVFKE